MSSSSGGGSFNTSGNPTRHFPPHRRVTSFADLFSSDKQEEQTINQPKSSNSSSGEIMNFEMVNNQQESMELIPTQMSFPAAAASLPPLSPPLSPRFSPSSFFGDHFPVPYSPSHIPPSPTMETFAGLFSTEEEVKYADLSSFAPTSAVMTAMDSLGDKEEDGKLIHSQPEFPTEPAPLPPSLSQHTPTVETTICFPQDIPTVESRHCFPQNILTIESARISPQDIIPVGTSLHGNSAYIRKKQRKLDDGYQWRKYGEKPVRGSNNPRGYYKCNYPNCSSRKKVERDLSGNIVHVMYSGTHNHPKPTLPERTFSISVLNPMGIPGYPRMDFGEGSSMRHGLEINGPQAKRQNGEGISASRRRRMTREPRVVIQTMSDVNTLEDGFRWRKYGEKTVKENPNPRCYYKCTSYGCKVTKQIERAPDDLRLVITTYEGRHNHGIPAPRVRMTYPLGRLPVMNNNSSRTAIMPLAPSSHSNHTMPQTIQNQTSNAYQMQQRQSVQEPNDDSLLYFDYSFLNDLLN